MANSHDSTEPVAWAVYWGLPPTRQNSVHFDKESAQAVANQIKSATEVRPLYAAPVAQQPQNWQPVTESDLAQVEAWLMTPASAMLPADQTHLMNLTAHMIREVRATRAAQQPQARPDFADEWTGYLKDGETPFERFLRERKDVQSVLKLYQRALEENERLKAQQPQAKPLFADLIAQHPGLREELLEMDKQPQAECRSDGRCQYAIDHGAEGLGHCPEGKCAMKQPQAEVAEVFYCKTCGTAMQMPHDDCLACERGERQQPQSEAVQACGHPMSLLLRSAESNEPLYCEACDDKSGRHDAERRETELLDANRRLQEKIGSADALKLHAIEELCQLGYTVKDGELFPPDHLHKLMEAANHPLCGKQTEAAQYTRADLDRAYSAGLVEGERLAIQQAEAVPPDVVRDAAPIPDHDLVTMYDERPTSDREMIEFAREVERRHGIGVQPKHITDGSPCWCNPDVAYTDPETGASVIVHRRPQ